MASGIAGDMTIAALLDIGVPLRVVEEAVDALGLDGVELEVRSGYAGAIGCTHFGVKWPTQEGERSFTDIKDLISHSRLEPRVKEAAIRVFLRLAEAEAAVHRTTVDQVHFHEVGAVDAIVDIVGAAAAFDYLGAVIKASPVPLGRGFVECRHGRLPLPAPAALVCLEGVPTTYSGLEAELVTPTGAALVGTLAEEFAEWFPMIPTRIGWGAGTQGLPDRPNALRVVLGRESPQSRELTHVVLEANVDDMTGELAAHALARLLEEGALDAWVVPVTMKKGRPGMVISALASLAQAAHLTEVILIETSSIGVRKTLVARTELERKIAEVSTPWGPVRVKETALGSAWGKAKPEMEDCRRIAENENLPLRAVLLAIQKILSERS